MDTPLLNLNNERGADAFLLALLLFAGLCGALSGLVGALVARRMKT